MKKTYVKPIMEMEGFIPNEYVAACWSLTCVWGCDYNNDDHIIGGDEYSENEFDECVKKQNADVIHAGNNSHINEDENKYYHSGNRIGVGGLIHHKLNTTLVTSGPHPNASN